NACACDLLPLLVSFEHGGQFKNLAKVRERPLRIALFLVRRRTVGVGASGGRIQLYGFVKVDNCQVQGAFVEIDVSAIVESQGEHWIELNGLVILCQSAVGITAGGGIYAPVVVGARQLGIELDRLIEVRESKFSLLLLGVCIPSLIVRGAILGINLDGHSHVGY